MSFPRAVVLLVFTASSLGGCAAQAPQSAPPRATEHWKKESAGSALRVPATPSPKVCGSRADFPPHHPVSWVENAREKLCCTPRREGGAWVFVEPETCVSRYAPWLRLPNVVEASVDATEPPKAAACSPGVEARLSIPAPELEARLDSGSLLRVESCVDESCAAANVAFDTLSRDDQLLFALEGTPVSGASVVWSAGAVQLSVRVVQSREQVVQSERYRLTLTLDGQPLRAIDTTLAYSTAVSPDCPLAKVTSAVRTH